MPTNKSRLDKLDTCLTTRQQVYKLIDKARQFRTLEEFTVWFCREENLAQLKNIFQHSKEALRAGMKGKDEAVIHKAVRNAYREGQFLHALFASMVASFSSDLYRHAYNELVLMDMMTRYALEMESNKGELSKEQRVEKGAETMRTWKHRATRHLFHLYTEKLIVEEIGRKHFEGRQLMFDADKENLDRLIESAHKLIERFNEAITDVVAHIESGESSLSREVADTFRGYIVDVDAAIRDVKANLPERVQWEEAMAKKDVFSNEDRTEQAFSILRSYMPKSAIGRQAS